MDKIVIGEQAKAYIFLLLGVLGFSLKSIFIKLGYVQNVSVNSLFILRMIFSLPFYLLVLIQDIPKLKMLFKYPNKRILLLLFASGVSYYITSLSDMSGLIFVNVAIERTILFLFPLVVALLSIFILNKKFGKKLFISIIICYFGVILTISSELNFGDINKNILLGIFLILISVVFYSLFYIISEIITQSLDAKLFNTLSMIIACGLTIILNLNFNHQGLFNFNMNVYIISLMMAIFSTVLPSFFIMRSIAYLGATTVSIYNNLGPFITILAGFLCLGERVTLMQIIGTSLVLYGIIFLKKAKM